MYKFYHVNSLDTRSSGCSSTKKTTRIFKLPSHDVIVKFPNADFQIHGYNGHVA